MKLFPIALLLVITSHQVTKAANTLRSDTVDVTHQHLDLRITDFVTKVISGHCITHVKAKMNAVTKLSLDLQGFTVDSVMKNGNALSYSYDDTVLVIALPTTLNTNDTTSVTVYYHGVPQADPQWGGFYWNGNTYAFNLGVAFESVPHTYGRAWFPCFDNFVERCTYSFAFTTPGDKMAVSNGLLTDSVMNGDGTRTWRWQIQQPIPSYLACVAVAGYTPVWQQYTTANGPTIPVMLAALPADTAEMKGSFVNLNAALEAFEEKFGPYVWEKVGYVAVPFSGGAMEHATCIAYPVATLDGNTTYETLMAHELSHHWFGDLVTCKTAGDMWLNEGWAVYAEHIFTEALYGEQAYFDAVQANHETVVHYAHVNDGAYFPLSGMPESETYGTTTYKKGADVAHTLRAYLGDEKFFDCVKNYIAAFSFQHATSADFRDFLSQCSGVDLTHFFNDWVYNPGFAAFWVDSFAVVNNAGGLYDVQVFLRQKLNHAPERFTNVPLELTFMNAAFDTVIRQVQMSGACATFTVQVPFHPLYVGCDLREKISDAVVGQNKIIDTVGNHNFVYGKMNLTVTNPGDSSFVRIEHRYAPPDPVDPPIPNLHISDYRHWKVEGVWGVGFEASSQIQYHGGTGTGGNLDNNLMVNSEDSVVLLYRAGVHHPWRVETDIVKTVGSPADKKGFIKINRLKRGEYALAIYDFDHPVIPVDVSPDSCAAFTGTSDPLQQPSFVVFPNPAHALVTLGGFTESSMQLEIHNALGYRLWRSDSVSGSFNLHVDTAGWAKGIYFVTARGGGAAPLTRRFAVVH